MKEVWRKRKQYKRSLKKQTARTKGIEWRDQKKRGKKAWTLNNWTAQAVSLIVVYPKFSGRCTSHIHNLALSTCSSSSILLRPLARCYSLTLSAVSSIKSFGSACWVDLNWARCCTEWWVHRQHIIKVLLPAVLRTSKMAVAWHHLLIALSRLFKSVGRWSEKGGGQKSTRRKRRLE